MSQATTPENFFTRPGWHERQDKYLRRIIFAIVFLLSAFSACTPEDDVGAPAVPEIPTLDSPSPSTSSIITNETIAPVQIIIADGTKTAEQIAAEYGLSYVDLVCHNPVIRKGILPPGTAIVPLLPPGKSERFLIEYTPQPGETMGNLADFLGCDLNIFTVFNEELFVVVGRDFLLSSMQPILVPACYEIINPDLTSPPPAQSVASNP